MFIAGAINVHLLRHHYSDENIEDKSLRQFQNRFKISREERTADKEAVVNVHYLKKNDHDIVVKSSQPQAVVVGDGDEVLPQDSRKKEHITDHSISINKSAKPQKKGRFVRHIGFESIRSWQVTTASDEKNLFEIREMRRNEFSNRLSKLVTSPRGRWGARENFGGKIAERFWRENKYIIIRVASTVV